VRRGPLLALLVLLLVAGGILAVLSLGGAEDRPQAAGLELLEWDPDRADAFVERATRGHSPVLYEKSPGGVRSSARRVARLRSPIEASAQDAGVDPDVLEAMVFLESAGREDARAGDDLEGAVGLTQILAGTATELLGMRVDVAAAERLTTAIGRAEESGRTARAQRLRARRRAVDERFDPTEALKGAGRYLRIARERLGGEELAVVSYHMGIGNVQTVLEAYGEDDPSWASVYFGSTPVDHVRAYRFLYRLGDDSATYLWRVYAAREIMRRHREGMLASRPPGEPARGEPVGLPEDAGLRCAGGDCALAREAAPVVEALGRGVREIAHTGAPLTVARAGGARLEIRRRYDGERQAEAFQFMLDRMETLALIRWERRGGLIALTVLR
jgi:hypothetical protein